MSPTVRIKTVAVDGGVISAGGVEDDLCPKGYADSGPEQQSSSVPRRMPAPNAAITARMIKDNVAFSIAISILRFLCKAVKTL